MKIKIRFETPFMVLELYNRGYFFQFCHGSDFKEKPGFYIYDDEGNNKVSYKQFLVKLDALEPDSAVLNFYCLVKGVVDET